MNMKRQLEIQRMYDRRDREIPERMLEAARLDFDPDDMTRDELVEFLDGVGVEFDRRLGAERLREIARGQG